MNRDKSERGRRFVVLDRDGTIIQERRYLSDPDQVSLIPGAGAALRELQQLGLLLVLITNQSGIGRGYFSRKQLQSVHFRLTQLLKHEGVRLDGVYVCPHKPDDDCGCRKPKLGLLEKAASDLGLGLEQGIVIGDKISDIEMGRAAHALTILVRTGYGSQFAGAVAADFVVDDLPAAIEVIKGLCGTRSA
jgi:D-glycero-D-manno-heptose 1,7-bisphosphate phosphatase